MSEAQLIPVRSKFLRYVKSYLPVWQKKKIGFYGNFGHGDIGDDALFIVARQIIDSNLLPLSKRCYAFNPAKLKGLLLGGGGLLRWEAPYIPRRLLTKSTWPFPVILFSAGINCDYTTAYSNEAKEKITALCRLSDVITVRDRISQQFLNDLGFSQARLLPDLELLLNAIPKQLPLQPAQKTVGITLTPHSEFDDAIFSRIVSVFTDFINYLSDKNYTAIFISFEQNISENTKEKEVINEIVRRAKRKEYTYIVEDTISAPEALSVIKTYCDYMVCMRLHGAVFAANAGTPFMCITYNRMHEGFLELFEAEKSGISLFEGFSLDALIERFDCMQREATSLQKSIAGKREHLRSIIRQELIPIKKLLGIPQGAVNVKAANG